MQTPLKISLIHPSRGRANKAFEAYDNWIKKSSGNVEIEHLLSLDQDDNFQEYLDILIKRPFQKTYYLIEKNSCVVEAVNNIAKKATGDILIYLSDDFDCPENWDEKIMHRILRANKTCEHPFLIKVDDCLQKYDVAVLTIPIMSKGLYNKLGYFWHPSYRSMFVDEDLYWTCKNNNWILDSAELKFPHLHPSNGKAENDETYKRSSANWNQGKEAFRLRKAFGFPL